MILGAQQFITYIHYFLERQQGDELQIIDFRAPESNEYPRAPSPCPPPPALEAVAPPGPHRELSNSGVLRVRRLKAKVVRRLKAKCETSQSKTSVNLSNSGILRVRWRPPPALEAPAPPGPHRERFQNVYQNRLDGPITFGWPDYV